MPKRDRFEVIDLATPLSGDHRTGFEGTTAADAERLTHNAALRVDRRFVNLDSNDPRGLTSALNDFFIDLLAHQLMPVHRKFASLFIGRQQHLASLRQQRRVRGTTLKKGNTVVAAAPATIEALDGPPKLVPLAETMEFLWNAALSIQASSTDMDLLLQSTSSEKEHFFPRQVAEDCKHLVSSHDLSIVPCFIEAQVVTDGETAHHVPHVKDAASGIRQAEPLRQHQRVRYRCIPVASLLRLSADELQRNLRHCIALVCISESQLQQSASSAAPDGAVDGQTTDPQWDPFLHRLVDLSYSMYLDLQEPCYDWSREDWLPSASPSSVGGQVFPASAKAPFGRGSELGRDKERVGEELVDNQLEGRIRLRSKHLLQTYHWPCVKGISTGSGGDDTKGHPTSIGVGVGAAPTARPISVPPASGSKRPEGSTRRLQQGQSDGIAHNRTEPPIEADDDVIVID